MIRLRLLAGPLLEGVEADRAQEVLRQPKLVALLSYLALEDRFVSRHTLLATFWPGLNEERGRAALRKMVFLARRALGDDVLLNRGDHEIGVSRSRLRCDGAEFRAAMREGDHPEAMRLYRGELLPGFYIRGAADFERWLEQERAGLAGMALHAGLTEAQTALLDEDYEVVLGWGRRLRDISPRSDEGPFLVITALSRMGEHSRALEEYFRYAAQLRHELGAGPSSRMKALAASIRTAAEASGGPRDTSGMVQQSDRGSEVEAGWDSFVERASDLMFEMDTQLYITRASPAAERLLGYTAAELVGMSFLSLVQPDHAESALAFYMRQMEERTGSAYHEFPALTSDGRLSWLGQSGQLVERGGRVAGIQVVARDITTQVRMAEVQRHLSLRDRVTDLYGPRGFHSMAEDRIKLAVRTRHKLLMLCLEADVAANGVAGVPAVLVARLLEATFRASDVVARVGDLRFAVLALERFDRTDQEWLEIIEGRLQEMALEQAFPAGVSLRMALVFTGDAMECQAQRLLSMVVGYSGRFSSRVLPPPAVLAL